MADIAAISAFLTSIKNATDIAKVLRTLDASVAQADLKFKIAELVEALADAKISAAELQGLLEEKDKEIARLTEALALTAEVVKGGDAYFKKTADGKPSGEPFCVHCWENKKHLYHLVRGARSNRMVCPTCKSDYDFYSIALVDDGKKG
jgi:hypothetical protein